MSVPWVLNVRRRTDADKSPHFCGETDAVRVRLCVSPARPQKTLPRRTRQNTRSDALPGQRRLARCLRNRPLRAGIPPHRRGIPRYGFEHKTFQTVHDCKLDRLGTGFPLGKQAVPELRIGNVARTCRILVLAECANLSDDPNSDRAVFRPTC